MRNSSIVDENSLIRMEQVVPKMTDSPFTNPINWQINSGEIWGIVGRNGSGKTLLTELICGKIAIQSGNINYHFPENATAQQSITYAAQRIKIIAFSAAYSLMDYRKLFYQQRFNHSLNDDTPTVRDLLPFEKISEANRLVFETFGIFDLMDRKMIQLSSGELRKILIANQLIGNPSMLIFDNPYIGLDEKARNLLNEMFLYLHSKQKIQLLFVTPSPLDLPDCTTHILEMKNCSVRYSGSKSLFHQEEEPQFDTIQKARLNNIFVNRNNTTKAVLPENLLPQNNEIVRMEKVDISYGQRIIQKEVNWCIRKGEKWALLGPNGAGKSTLLSYIFADNPQAYAKNISLFGKKRGSGESIWDIKKRIGYSSSELHLYYRENISCVSVVASGYFDIIGMPRKANDQQLEIAEQLMDMLNISYLKDKPFLKVSAGEQRLLFFARAIIKNPELLILDEPFHGLDAYRKALCHAIIELYATQPGKSLIYVTHRIEEIPSCVNHQLKLAIR